jgi:hypothetical protein
MPKYKTHLLGGLVTFFIIFSILQYIKVPQKDILIYLSACLIGSIFPDIDTKSKIQKILYSFLFFVSISSIIMKKWQFVAIISIFAFIPMMVNHRRLTHKPWFLIVFPLSIPITVSQYYSQFIHTAIIAYIFFVGGALSHIWLDFGFKGIFKRKW